MSATLKTALIAALLSLSVLSAKAQYNSYYELHRLRNELSVGYSYAPSYSSWPGLRHMLSKNYMFEQSRFDGTLNLSFKSMINPMMAITGTVAVTRFRGAWFTTSNPTRRDIRHTITSVTAGLKYLWLDRNMFQIYTKGDVGLAFATSRKTEKDGSRGRESNMSYALSFSPVGFRYGYRLAVYGELMVGTFGYFNIGVAYCW